MAFRKNTASQTWVVFAFDRTDASAKTLDAANITANIKKDTGAAAATNDVNPTELEDGYYSFDLTQAETNANEITLFPVSATGDIQVVGVPARLYPTATVIIGPAQTTISPGNFVGPPLTLQMFQQESKAISITVVDGNGDAIDLDGKTLRFTVITDEAAPTGLFKVDTGDIAISGASNEIATISISAITSAVASGDYVWRLWDVDNEDVFSYGPFQILPALPDVS